MSSFMAMITVVIVAIFRLEVFIFGVLRFKFKKKYKSLNDFYNEVKEILGEPNELRYKSNWNGKEFVKTDEICYFSYEEKAGNYSIRIDDENKYLDYHLIDSDTNYQDLYVSLDLDNLNDIKLKTFDKFPNLLYDSCKVKIFEW